MLEKVNLKKVLYNLQAVITKFNATPHIGASNSLLLLQVLILGLVSLHSHLINWIGIGSCKGIFVWMDEIGMIYLAHLN